MPKADDFRAVLNQLFKNAQDNALPYIDVKAGDLHRKVGGYPGPNHRMPVCCSAMRGMMKPGDKVLDEPPKGQGANLKIRYFLPRILDGTPIENMNTTMIDQTRKTPHEKSSEFEELAKKIMSNYYKTSLKRGQVSGVPKEFDMVSQDGRIVGDAKYLTMVRGKSIPPAKFSIIAEHVWLLEKAQASDKFLVFGNDRRVPERWLEKHSYLIKNVAFFFLDMDTQKLDRLNH